MKGLIVLLGVFFVSAANAAEPQYFLCKNKKIVRTLRSIPPVSEGTDCKAVYTKNGEDKEVGAGKMYSSCVNIINNIKTNLEKAGWTCKDISSSKISNAQ